jgi:hypothetical protein
MANPSAMQTLAIKRSLSALGIDPCDYRVLLEDWIRWPPSLAYIRRGMRQLLALALAPDEFELDLEDLRDLLGHAEAIARTCSSAPDSPFAVGPDEERALAEIARTLHVDNGVSWASLLRELESSAVQNGWPN